MISGDRTALIVLRGPEIVGVPGCLDTVDEQVSLNTNEGDNDRTADANSSLKVGLEDPVSLDHHKEGTTDVESHSCGDIAFAAILASIAAHKELRNVGFAVLIVLHFEHGDVVKHSVDDA